MAENKTKPTGASVKAYIDAVPMEEKRQDCRELTKLMTRVSKYKPRMLGSSIIGFGSYHYKYESGHEGDCCLTGFSPRKGAISIYLMGNFPSRPTLLAQLGRHKMGKSCLYIRKLSDVNLPVLEQLLTKSIAAVRQRYGPGAERPGA